MTATPSSRSSRSSRPGAAPTLAAAVLTAILATLAAAPGPAGAQQEGAGAGAVPAAGMMVVAARTIRSRSVIAPSDLRLVPAGPGAGLRDIDAAVGKEARAALQAGRPIRAADLAPPAAIERNDRVTLRYRRGALTILAEGRALERGAVGASVRVMNLDSRVTVTGRVRGPALVEVGS